MMEKNNIETTEAFKKTEKKLLKLKTKLEERIDRTDKAMIEARKIREEIKKIKRKS